MATIPAPPGWTIHTYDIWTDDNGTPHLATDDPAPIVAFIDGTPAYLPGHIDAHLQLPDPYHSPDSCNFYVVTGPHTDHNPADAAARHIHLCRARERT